MNSLRPNPPKREPMKEKKKKKKEEDHLPSPADSKVTTEKKKRKQNKKKKDDHLPSPADSHVTTDKKKRKTNKKKKDDHLPSPADSKVTTDKKKRKQKKKIEDGNLSSPTNSKVTTERKKKKEGKNLSSPTNSHVRAEDDAVFMTTTALPEGPLEVTVEGECESRVLQEVPIKLLPLRCQRLLTGPSESRINYCRRRHINDGRRRHINVVAGDLVEFLPGFTPNYNPSGIALGLAVLTGSITFREADRETVSFPIGITAMVILIISTVIVTMGIKKRREPLFAKNSRGIQKPYPGDWNGGVYLVGNVGLLQYDPIKERAWWFPLQSILDVNKKRKYGGDREWAISTRLTIKLPQGTLTKHYINRLFSRHYFNTEEKDSGCWNTVQEEDTNFEQIYRWHRRFSLENP